MPPEAGRHGDRAPSVKCLLYNDLANRNFSPAEIGLPHLSHAEDSAAYR